MMEDGLDIDWFALDQQDNVLHFASGGGGVPKTIKEGAADNEYLRSFLIGLPKLNDGIKLSQDLSKFVAFKSEESRNAYLNDFLLMASVGLFSFDKSFLGQPSDNRYHLVCIPAKRLSFESLPPDVRNILKRTRIAIKAEEVSSIEISAII